MKRNCLVINRLTRISRSILIILKLLWKFDVYYLDMDSLCRNETTIKNLEQKGIRWVKREYTKFSQYYKSQVLSVEYSELIYKKASLSFINKYIERMLRVGKNHKSKMDVVWKYSINRTITSFAEQYAAAKYLHEKQIYQTITIISFNSLAFMLKDTFDNDNIRKIILPGLYFFKIIGMLNSSAFLVLRRAKLLFRRKGVAVISQNTYKKANTNAQTDYSKFQVVYFPHQGIYYGEMFKKDHFYIEDIESPFHKQNILHFSFGEPSDSYMIESYKYYEENCIPYADFKEADYNKLDLASSILKLFLLLNFRVIADLFRYGLWYIFFSLYLFQNIKKYCLILSKLENLKVALAGYDWLFPRSLAFALTLQGVKVCASEERFIIAFFPDNYLILDYYFVASDIVKAPCLKTSQIDNFVPVGLIRVDSIYEYETNQIYDEKYDSIKKSKKLIMALDFYLPSDDIADTFRPAAKAYEIVQFYEDLIRLAKEFPSIHIVIKGKEADSYESHYISGIIDQINKLENIEIEINYARYNPYFIGEKVDLTIACHTSLCDELLAARRKVIFYEITDRLDTLFNYQNLPIIVKNYEELKHHVKNFFNGIYLDKETTRKIEHDFFNDCYHGNIGKEMRAILEQIIQN